MSQSIWSSINPLTTSGIMLAGLLTDFKDAIMTGFAGTSRPPNLQAGGMWVDTTNQAAPNYYWAFKMYTGSTDVEIFRISILNGFGGTLTADATFTIQEIAADAVGPILNLVKNRVADNGQVLSGDTVGEIRFTGRTDSATDPTVAYIKYVATDDQETSGYGGTLSFYSTPDASAAIEEHLRFVNGLVETVSPYKPNSLRLVSQDVATTATILQLDASKILVEMTGATNTTIKSIDSEGDTQLLTIHNRSTGTITLSNENTDAAAEDRFSLPKDLDHTIEPERSTTLYYCTTDARWKIKDTVFRKLTRTIEEIRGAYQTWTAPDTTRIIVNCYRNGAKTLGGIGTILDPYGNMYAWGMNASGELGVGDVTARSSPVAVLGGLTFLPLSEMTSITAFKVAIDKTGTCYCWGDGAFVNLGVGDANSRSSPVAVSGSLKFLSSISCIGLTMLISENDSLYAWGDNTKGQLGDGTVTFRRVPTLVLGGLKFGYVNIDAASGTQNHVVAITKSGAGYAWGINDDGELGVGDVTSRSSPVAILGGLTFKKILARRHSLGLTQSFSVGLTSTGVAYAWGGNIQFQLGVGDQTSRSSPVAVLGGLTFKDIYAMTGIPSVYGLTSAGELYAWGDNSLGQLGVGDVTDRSSPVQVLGGLTFKRMWTIQDSVFAQTTTGALYAWGSNGAYQLGLGDNVDRSSPVAVLGGFTDWTHLTNNGLNTSVIGIRADGSTYAWGHNNGKGTLGTGSSANTSFSSPILVVGSFGQRSDVPVSRKVITVSPNTSYTVLLAQGNSFFGSTPLGYNIDYITISYDI